MRFFTIRFLEHFAYPLTPYVTLYLSWGIFQIIQHSCRAVQRGYFQETLGCRKEFDLVQLQLKEKKLLSIMTFTRLHTCPWKELMERLSSAFSFPLTIFLPLVSFTKRWWTAQWHLSFFLSLLSLSLLRDGVWKSSWFITSWRLRMASL